MSLKTDYWFSLNNWPKQELSCMGWNYLSRQLFMSSCQVLYYAHLIHSLEADPWMWNVKGERKVFIWASARVLMCMENILFLPGRYSPNGIYTCHMTCTVLTVAVFPLPNELFHSWRKRNEALIPFRVLKVQIGREAQWPLCNSHAICYDSTYEYIHLVYQDNLYSSQQE